MSDSACAGLTASLARQLRDEGGPEVAAQVLIDPILDSEVAYQPVDHAISRFLTWTPAGERTG